MILKSGITIFVEYTVQHIIRGAIVHLQSVDFVNKYSLQGTSCPHIHVLSIL